MTQEDRKRLLKYLGVRLSYGAEDKDLGNDCNISIVGGDIDLFSHQFITIKPYLRPMSSMTEEEKVEYYNTMDKETQRNYPNSCDFSESVYYSNTIKTFDWLNAHHFDYRGLIPKGLALEAPEGMYN